MSCLEQTLIPKLWVTAL